MTPRPDLHRIDSLLDLGRYREALDRLAPLFADHPEDPELHGLRARGLLGLEQPAEALAAGNRVVALVPDDAWGHQLCALALIQLGNHAEATAAAAEAVRLEPNHWNTHRIYASAALGVPGRGADAYAAAHRAVQLAPHEPAAHFVLGLVAERQRDVDLARTAYQETLALDPNHPGALNNLTNLRGGLRISRAAHGYASALREEPGSSVVQANLDLLAFRFLRRLYWPAVLALLVALLIAQAGGALAPVSGFTVTLGLGVLAAGATYSVLLGRALPVGVRRYALDRIPREPLLLCTALLSGAMLLTLVLVCLVPGADEVARALVRVLGLANVAIVVWGITWASNRG